MNTPKPTKTELAILNVMWQISPATVRQIHEELIKKAKTSYTTTLKMLQVMYQKGLVSRNSEQKAHIYEPILTKKETQAQMLDDLKHRLFGGSISSLVLQALGNNSETSAKEIEEIKALLENVENKNI
ncbi:BlaI/MecI/CopY family transcriptional regulator [Marinicella rhabdoformis]|uniref:BlaI/MecI/CopY family transcriptional regulator n=1 Tax=Marinicella rhabdoformis TaxID=2580566 RepID=UPI0012AEC0C4|nr:BlaI/MecI/CopY family transcriptional regulator [Marinicella rhabdoformis]